jgi:endonuclease/exonuclease/phosphatase family metal-dependent hydrolase
MRPMTRFTDGLAQARPLPTSPAEAPKQQIDQVFVTRQLATSDIVAPRTTASDHLMVAVTVRFNS